MTQEFINRLFAAVMGKCWHEWELDMEQKPSHEAWLLGGHVISCKNCGASYEYVIDSAPPSIFKWSASSDGEATKEVRDWFTKEMPEEWCKWAEECLSGYQDDGGDIVLSINDFMSIDKFAQFIVVEYEKKSGMFYEECPNMGKDGHNHPANPCPLCNGTGKTVIPRYKEAVEIIRRYLDGK